MGAFFPPGGLKKAPRGRRPGFTGDCRRRLAYRRTLPCWAERHASAIAAIAVGEQGAVFVSDKAAPTLDRLSFGAETTRTLTSVALTGRQVWLGAGREGAAFRGWRQVGPTGRNRCRQGLRSRPDGAEPDQCAGLWRIRF